MLITKAKSAKLEKALTTRIDSTVTKSMIHEPTDSRLLNDSVRMKLRQLDEAVELPGQPMMTFAAIVVWRTSVRRRFSTS